MIVRSLIRIWECHSWSFKPWWRCLDLRGCSCFLMGRFCPKWGCSCFLMGRFCPKW